MPVIEKSSYPAPPFFQFNGHLQTIMPALTRKVEISYERERLELPDGDFLDLDWSDAGSRQLVILSHGLEGNSDRHYIKGMGLYFFDQGWDVLAWNCRSCSGEMNRNARLYNHGEIEDIATVITHALKTKDYTHIALVGFSMGGSITLKYLGVHGKTIPDAICTGIAFSSPCDLKASVDALEYPENFIYRRRFARSLRAKIEQKAAQFPGIVDLSNFEKVKCWEDFDNFFSAPINGYTDARDFYNQASAKNYMDGITVPALLVNAQNDPILLPACSPVELCKKHPLVYLEMPRKGGHVGFSLAKKPFTWAEYRAFQFVKEMLHQN